MQLQFNLDKLVDGNQYLTLSHFSPTLLSLSAPLVPVPLTYTWLPIVVKKIIHVLKCLFLTGHFSCRHLFKTKMEMVSLSYDRSIDRTKADLETGSILIG